MKVFRQDVSPAAIPESASGGSTARSGHMDMAPANSNKIGNLAIVCSFLVVLIHCRPQFDHGSFAWYFKEMTENGVSEMAVPFFFVVSGAMLGRKLARGEGMANRWGREVFKRLKTLVIPFFIWNALYWLATKVGPFLLMRMQGAQGECPMLPTASQFGLWYTGCPFLTPLWYVRALFVLVLVSPLLLWALEKTGGYILLLLFALYGNVCPYYPMPEWNAVKDFARVGILPVLGVFYFSFGLAISTGFAGSKPVSLSPWLSLGIGLGLLFLRAVCEDAAFPMGACYLGFFALPFLLYGAWRLVPSRKWPDWLVKNAFPVFLVHKFCLSPIKKLPLGDGVFSYLACALLVFAGALFAANVIRRLSPKCAVVLFGGR